MDIIILQELFDPQSQVDIWSRLIILNKPNFFAIISKLRRVRSSVVERVPDKNEVEGSIPSAPTQ